ncbi:hypothetical protein [Nonomuraea lactucae]|uniref:WD40 repeat domain-containing protein n=1 Tax=Nonomuraea lactucae TaxID=2249762 RepID=UPI0030843B02
MERDWFASPDPHGGGEVYRVALAPIGGIVAAGNRDGTVTIWNADTRTLVRHLTDDAHDGQHPNSVQSLTISPDATLIAARGVTDVRIWNLDRGGGYRRHKLRHTHHGVCRLVDGRGIWINEPAPGAVELRDADTFARLAPATPTRPAPDGDVLALAFTPDATLLVGAADLTRWQPTEPALVQVDRSRQVTGLAVSADGRYTVHVTQAKKVTVVEDGAKPRTPRPASRLPLTRGVAAIAFHPHQPWLAVAGGDSTVRIWDLPRGTETMFDVTAVKPRSVAFSQDGRYLAVGSTGRVTFVYDLDQGALLHKVQPRSPRRSDPDDTWPSRYGPVHAVAFARGGRLLAAGSEDGYVTLWDTVTGKLVHEFRAHRPDEPFSYGWAHSGLCALVVHPDGEHLATGGGDRRIAVWTLDGERTAEFTRDATVRAPAVSADGALLAASGHDRCVGIWHWRNSAAT